MQEIEYSFRNEANSLIIERDILTKTIFRVYQKDSNLTKIQRDKLLTRYQHQLAVVVTKIDEIGKAMRDTGTNHSDEGLFAAMEQKLSTMDERLQEISSKISTPKKQAERQTQRSKSYTQQSIQKHRKKATYQSDMNVDSNNYKPLEITTLTEVPSKLPEFFQSNFKPPKLKVENIQSNVDVAKVVENVIQSNICINPGCTNPKFTNKYCSAHTDSYEKETSENKNEASLPSLGLEQPETKQHILKENPVELSAQESSSELAQDKKDSKLSQDNDLEENDDDVKDLKAKIEKSLANLDQAEVE